MEFDDFVIDTTAVTPMLRGYEAAPDIELHRWLLVGVTGTAIVRKTWYDDAEVSEALFQELAGGLAPAPSFEKTQKHRLLDEASRYARVTRCRACAIWKGRIPCSVCGGRGSLSMPGQDGEFPCSGCDRRGSIVCAACDGTQESYDVRVAYHEDHPLEFAHVFVADEIAALRPGLVAFLQRQSYIPDALKLDLASEFAPRDAYRGRRGDHEHRSHRLGNALAAARRYVERIMKSPTVVHSRHRAIGWPVASLAHQPSSGFVIDAEGNPKRV